MHDNGTQTIKPEVVEPIVEVQETCREEANTSSSYSPSPRTVYTCNDGKVGLLAFSSPSCSLFFVVRPSYLHAPEALLTSPKVPGRCLILQVEIIIIIIIAASLAMIISVYWPGRVPSTITTKNSVSDDGVGVGGGVVLQAQGPAATSSVKNTCKLEHPYVRDPVLIICTSGISS